MFPFFVKVEQKLIFYRLMTFLSRCYYQSSNFLIYILCQSSSHFPGFKDLESVFPTWLNFLIENFFLMFIFFQKDFISSLVLWTLVSSNFLFIKIMFEKLTQIFVRIFAGKVRMDWGASGPKCEARRLRWGLLYLQTFTQRKEGKMVHQERCKTFFSNIFFKHFCRTFCRTFLSNISRLPSYLNIQRICYTM